MGRLGYYINRVDQTHGLIHIMAIRALRKYMNDTPQDEVIADIDMLTKPEHFKALWEAGLNGVLQTAVLRRAEEVMERRG